MISRSDRYKSRANLFEKKMKQHKTKSDSIKHEKTKKSLNDTSTSITKIMIEKNNEDEIPSTKDITLNETVTENSPAPVKRKRGRPRKNTNIIPTKKQPNVEPAVKKVKQSEENKAGSVLESVPLVKRTPRLASLNALAKVNAVLENYRFDVRKIVKTDNNGTLSSSGPKELKNKPIHNKDSLDSGIMEKHFNKVSEMLNEESIKDSNVSQEENKKIPLKTTKKDSSCLTEDRAVQTDTYDKSVQTEEILFEREEKCTNTHCYCQSINQSPVFELYSPICNNKIPFPLHMKSLVLCQNESHTLALPLTKTHLFYGNKTNDFVENDYKSKNIVSLVDQCRTNVFMKHSSICSNLVQQTEESFKPEILYTGSNLQQCSGIVNQSKDNVILPPVVNGSQKNLKKGRSSKVKLCNGWKFEGEYMEELFNVDGEIVTRRYYQGLQRKQEIIAVHDAVILQSGARRHERDYIARVAAVWEDLTGPFKDEMMISVFWYYKPEQINGKCPDVSIDEMEVFASRHQDDNSVACIVDKCYVVSFPQFNRFRAQNMLWHKKRLEKLSLVPEHKRYSRLIPRPDVDPSLVFFCRYAYDYRLGRILKS